MTTSSSLDRDDPPILGANPFVGLTRGQIAAALARVAQRAAVEPGALLATRLEALGDLVRVGVGRSDVEPANSDRRFADRAWRENPVVPPPHAGLPRRATRRPPPRRRGGARPQEPRPRPLRHVPPHRSGRTDQQPAHQPQRDRQGCPDPRAEPGRRCSTPGPRRPSQRWHAVAGRHPPLRGRRQSGRHARAGRAPHGDVRADPVRTVDDTGAHPTPRRHPPADQQVLHHRPGPGTQPRRSHRRRRHPVLHAQLAQPDIRTAGLEPRHLCRGLPGSDRGRLRHHRQRRRQRRRHVRRWHHARRAARTPRRQRRRVAGALGHVLRRRARRHDREHGLEPDVASCDRGGTGALPAGRDPLR